MPSSRRRLYDTWRRLVTQPRPRSALDALAIQGLAAASVGYGAVAALRNAAYDRGWLRPKRLPCPVISVGNLTVGGTGKTACVELLAGKLRSRGRRVGILSRGYGGGPGEYRLSYRDGRLMRDDAAVTDAEVLADEPQLLARHLPGVEVFVGARRERTGRAACARGCEVLVLDDAFQHRGVHRDCDIVLVHAGMPPGGERLLPRGPMREPCSSLARADVVILTKADEAWDQAAVLRELARRIAPDVIVVSAAHVPVSVQDPCTGETHAPGRLSRAQVGLLSTIGDPRGFEATVSRCEASIAWHLAWPDHHRYREAEWEALAAQVRRARPDAVVTTEKDWVRLAPVAAASLARRPLGVPLWVLPVRMEIIAGEAELDARLARV